MSGRIAYLYVLDTMADWEPGLVIAELNSGNAFRRGERVQVRTVALSRDPVTSMGGVTILPDLTVADMQLQEAAVLNLPGGNTWDDPRHAPAIARVEQFLTAEIPVAAICGATVALAAAGILNSRRHTSNDLGYLKQVCPAYTGEALYQQEPAVTDGNLITTTGIAPLEFAYQILKRLGVFAEATLEAWYRLFSTCEARYCYALRQSVAEYA
jgi:putative intracellular protease/amidase